MELNEQIRQRMRACREEARISQMGMAMLLHMDERNYKRIESGERKVIDIVLAGRFCEVLHISPAYLLLGHDEPQPNHREVIAIQEQIITAQKNALAILKEMIASYDNKKRKSRCQSAGK